MGYESAKIKLEGLLKIMLMSKKPQILAQPKTEDLLILGNGPSLGQDKEKLLKMAETRDVVGVNFFAATEEFLEFKPDYHVIVSHQFWGTDENQRWDQDRKQIFKTMVDIVDWELNLFVPIIARKSPEWVKHMSQNSNIKLNYFNTTPLDDYPLFFRKKLKKFKACPRPHNVLVPSILMGINLGYKRVYIAGAEHSWIPELFVTQDNVVMCAQKHFYSDQFKEMNSTLLMDNAKPFYFENSLKTKKLHEVLQKFLYAFKSYWFLKEYAEAEGVKIYNLTVGSYIDAFEKVEYEQVTA